MRDLIFSGFVRDYLDATASHTAGVPASNVCALLRMDLETDDKDPRICIEAVEQGETRQKQITVVAVCRGTSPRETTDPWMKAVEKRLYDQEALWEFIAALPLETRKGWQIERISPPHAAKVQRDPGGVLELGVGVVFYVTI